VSFHTSETEIKLFQSLNKELLKIISATLNMSENIHELQISLK